MKQPASQYADDALLPTLGHDAEFHPALLDVLRHHPLISGCLPEADATRNRRYASLLCVATVD